MRNVKAGATPPTRLPHVMFQNRPSPLLTVHMRNARSREALGTRLVCTATKINKAFSLLGKTRSESLPVIGGGA